MKMKNSLINHLPEDVLINKILLKLDTKSLGKLRCVCKYLQSFISSSAFLKMHCHDQFNNNPLVLLVYSGRNLVYSLNFNIDHPLSPEGVEIMGSPFSVGDHHIFTTPHVFGSCNGLLCLVERYKPLQHPLGLWNPTTNEYKMLPPPMTDLNKKVVVQNKVSYGFGYDCIIDDYKVILCENYLQHGGGNNNNNDTDHSITGFQVYTLGTNTWKRINDNPYESYFTTPYHGETSGMFVNGALHWIMSKKRLVESTIIAFDIEKEIFRVEVPTPHSGLISDSTYNWSICTLRGCLCIYERELNYGSKTHVWMMKNYGVMESSWTKLFTFPYFCFDLKVLQFWENGEFLVALKDHHQRKKILFLYDPINKKRKSVKYGEIDGISHTEIYTESLVSLNTGIYRYGI